jgi:predicted nucleic-acid-binding protein
LLRLLVDDHEQQCGAARAFMAMRTAHDQAFVSATVLAELIWLLRRRFRYSNEDILRALRAMASTRELRFEYGNELRSFLELDGTTPSDVADALVAWASMSAKCDKVVTFDKRSARLIPSMELLA